MSGRAAPERHFTIGLAGRFEGGGFGDRLFDALAGVALERRLGQISVRRYRPRGPAAGTLGWRPLARLADEVEELDLLVVGGSDQLRHEIATIPGTYPLPGRVRRVRTSLVAPIVHAAAVGVPVLWRTTASHAAVSPWRRPSVAASLGVADLVWVPDPATADAFAGLDPQGRRPQVVPEVAWAAAALSAADPEAAAAIREAHGLDRYVVVQASDRFSPVAEPVRAGLDRARAAGIAIVEVAVARGDRLGLLELPTGAISASLTAPDTASLVGLVSGAVALLAADPALAIAATAAGVPVHRPASGTAAARLTDGIGATIVGPAWSGLDGAEPSGDDGRTGPATAASATGAAARRAAVEAAWDRLADLAEGGPPAGRTRRSRLVQAALEALPSEDAAERRRLERELGLRTAKLQQARDDARARADELALARRELRSLRSSRSVRLALWMGEPYRRARVAARRGYQVLRSLPDRLRFRIAGPGPLRTPGVATRHEERALVGAIRRDARVAPRTTGPLVSVVILNHSGEEHLRRCLPGLDTTDYADIEVIVVDNASTDGSLAYLRSLRPRFPLRIIENAENRSFSAANNQALVDAKGDLVLFLNNDIEPITPHWLGHMVDTLIDEDAVAVGARLIYPRSHGIHKTARVVHPDLSLQHRGIDFRTGEGVPRAHNLGTGGDPRSERATAVREVAAATAACLLLRRDALEAAGGLSEAYHYGTEDVDMCLKLRAAGGRIFHDGRAALWHHESATIETPSFDRRTSRAQNRREFVDRWGPRIFREVMLDRVDAAGAWSEEPLHVGITVTRDDPTAGYGDWFTAHELGDALGRLGWTVSYPERYGDAWYHLDPSIDVLVVLLDAYDVRRAPRHMVTVAWIRNWTERWVARPWFEEYDLVLASSEQSREIVETRTAKPAHLFPIATNPARFAPREPDPELAADVVFTGSHWGAQRGVIEALPALAAGGLRVRVFGRGWDTIPGFETIAEGLLDYDRLPAAYASAGVVVDDSAGHARPYGAVNARVFDALAAGTIVVSNDPIGTRELFGRDFPTWTDGASLDAVIRQLTADPAATVALVERLRARVLERHTYDHRAEAFRRLLRGWVEARRVGICIGVPDWERAPAWGDYHFARDLQRELERRGVPTRVHLLPSWTDESTARDDVILHLFGLSALETRPGQLNVLWNISHPDLVSPELLLNYDIAFTASDRFADRLAGRVRIPVLPLHQATDPDRFRPDPSGPVHELLFVANSRGVARKIIDDLTPTTHDLAVYGRGWTPDLLDPRYLRGDHVPNQLVHTYYSSAAIVLNDHWPDMRAEGFLSNRLYDALACGAFVISDHVEGIDHEFDGGVVTYHDPADLRELVDRYLADPEARRAVAERGRRAVLARHTFGHRIETLLAELDPLLRRRPTRIAPAARPASPSRSGRPRRARADDASGDGRGRRDGVPYRPVSPGPARPARVAASGAAPGASPAAPPSTPGDPERA